MDLNPVCSGPKGRDMTAQGNALGKRKFEIGSPARAQ
jgi:hypothetical protein